MCAFMRECVPVCVFVFLRVSVSACVPTCVCVHTSTHIYIGIILYYI